MRCPLRSTGSFWVFLLLTVSQTFSFLSDTRVTSSLSIQPWVLSSDNQTSSKSSNHEDDSNETEAEDFIEVTIGKDATIDVLIGKCKQIESGFDYATILNRPHTSTPYSNFRTTHLIHNQRPFGGFNWSRNRVNALFSTPNQNFNVIQNNESRTANAEAGAATKLSATTLLAYSKAIFKMCRPHNLPGPVIIHLVTLRIIQAAFGASFMELFLSSGQLATLAASLLITCVSMLLNDYYDSKSGLDLENEIFRNSLTRVAESNHPFDTVVNGAPSGKPLVNQEIPRMFVRQFITFLCIGCILCTFTVPSNISKFGIVASGVIVYYYTEYIKPITWMKNVCCASLIAASPFVTAMSALSQLTVDKTAFGSKVLLPVGRMILALFAWSMSREIVMDIEDYYGDKKLCLQTVPVQYGRRFASKVALAFSGLFSALAISGPLSSYFQSIRAFEVSSRWNVVLYARLVLATIGGLSMFWNMMKVVNSEGDDREICNRAVDSSLISVAFVLLSFV
mmetsp:Transcript_27711/g.39648  ORF Transcript_27711/g.39648 Transcript_27711/m.39648 type:complete len:508 (+) Transcript_27711:87-1610(+)|eukprot:CAMPEP_0172428366 /NCGR_PEP_ID=MMETSP1064-20121228/46053_1 /TAXON_ID=202472 /ORGANISM="Aulacoseira subarctica , Strain CCAP 1002/5" /LENGTH=507 /DNA_ID=CAMNT_0013173107 /DNA_START=29 /DNA_END=1552 /DNA_ORIENTATION=+